MCPPKSWNSTSPKCHVTPHTNIHTRVTVWVLHWQFVWAMLWLIVKGTQHGHTPLDPVFLKLVGWKLNGKHKVCGVTSGGQCTWGEIELQYIIWFSLVINIKCTIWKLPWIFDDLCHLQPQNVTSFIFCKLYEVWKSWFNHHLIP